MTNFHEHTGKIAGFRRNLVGGCCCYDKISLIVIWKIWKIRDEFGVEVVKPSRITRVNNVDHLFRPEIIYGINQLLAGKMLLINDKFDSIFVYAMTRVVINERVIRANLCIQQNI